MTEASAQVESKTLQAFLDFIPTKELIGVATGAAKAVALRAPGTVEESVELRLNVKQDNFRYTHTKYVEISLASPCRPTPGGVVEAPYALRIEAPTGGSGNIDASDTIDVTGKIKLPTGSVKQP